MRKRIKAIIIIASALLFVVALVLGCYFYYNKKIHESIKHFKKAEAYYAESKYEEAISEYSLVHKWDTDNYNAKAEKISICKTKKMSSELIEKAKNYEKNLDYKNAIKTYKMVPQMDNTYYSIAQNASNELEKVLRDAKFILKYTKSIKKRFGYQNKDIEKLYCSRGSGTYGKKEVAVVYSGAQNRLYIVTNNRPNESEYMTVYKTNSPPQYISVIGEVQLSYGLFASTTNSLKEETAGYMIETYELTHTKADESLLEYVKKH